MPQWEQRREAPWRGFGGPDQIALESPWSSLSGKRGRVHVPESVLRAHRPVCCSWEQTALSHNQGAAGKRCQSSSGAKINPRCLCSRCQIQLNNELHSFSTNLSHLLLIWCNRCTVDKVGANSASLWASGAGNLKQHYESNFSFVDSNPPEETGYKSPFDCIAICIFPLLLGKTHTCFNCPSLIYCDLDPLSKLQSLSYGMNY